MCQSLPSQSRLYEPAACAIEGRVPSFTSEKMNRYRRCTHAKQKDGNRRIISTSNVYVETSHSRGYYYSVENVYCVKSSKTDTTSLCYGLRKVLKLPIIQDQFAPSTENRSHSIGNQLVSWCFEPNQPQRITSGLNTNFTLSPRYSFQNSSYHKSCFLQPIYIPWALNTGTCIQQGDLFYSAGLHRNHVLATTNTGKIGRGSEKMQVNGLEGQK